MRRRIGRRDLDKDAEKSERKWVETGMEGKEGKGCLSLGHKLTAARARAKESAGANLTHKIYKLERIYEIYN